MITVDVEALADALASRLTSAMAKPDQARSSWLSVRDAAEYLGVSETAVRALIKRRHVPFCKPNGRIFIDRRDLDEWVRSGAAT